MNAASLTLRLRAPAERGTSIFLGALAIAAFVVLVYHDTFGGILRMWWISTYRHCAFVMPLAFYLLWRRRERLAREVVEPSWLGLALLFGAVCVWQVGRVTATQALEQGAAITTIPLAVLAVLGRRQFAAGAYPLLMMLTAIPVGEALIPPLMELTADISTTLLTLFGLPVFRDGMYISLSGGEFVIAELCAGLNYLLASLSLALLFACITFHSAWRRAVFIISMLVVFTIANGVRAFIVMLVASATELRHFAGYDHVIFGMFFYFAVLALIFWVGMKFADTPPARSEETAPVEASARQPKMLFGFIAAAVVLAFGPMVHAFQRNYSAALPEESLPHALPGCEGPLAWSASWQPVLHGADSDKRGSYRCGDVTVNVLVGTYVQQQQGKELISSQNRLVPADWWTRFRHSDATATLGAGRALPVNEVTPSDEAAPFLGWYWFRVNSTSVRSELDVKIREALASMTFRPVVSRVYVIDASADKADAQRLRAVVSDVAGALTRDESTHGR